MLELLSGGRGRCYKMIRFMTNVVIILISLPPNIVMCSEVEVAVER